MLASLKTPWKKAKSTNFFPSQPLDTGLFDILCQQLETTQRPPVTCALVPEEKHVVRMWAEPALLQLKEQQRVVIQTWASADTF